jgi:hypothetical protein
MMYLGDKVTLPDGRCGTVLDSEMVKLLGHTVREYSLRFDEEPRYATYIPDAMLINYARLQ